MVRPLAVALTALVWAAFVVGCCEIALTLPVYTSAAEQVLRVPATAGLSRADVITLSEQVRALVADARYKPLPSTWRGRPAFDRAAVSHLLDVRAVMSAARVATGASALLLAVLVAACVAQRRTDLLWEGMWAGALVIGLVAVVSVVGAATSFDAFFAAFHGIFFKAGTWMFPADSLLIRLFPERFWETAGAMWAGLSLAGAGVLAVAARMLRARASGFSASRTADNV